MDMKCLKNFQTALMMLLIPLISACSGSNEGSGTGILVSTDWVQEQLGDPGLILLHSGAGEIYDSIHIPGARLIIPSHFTTDEGNKRNEIPEADSLVKMLSELGVNEDSRIVLYHESARLLTRTARVYLTLDQLGLGEQSFLMNGGLPAWQEEDRELTDRVPEIRPGKLSLPELKDVVVKWTEIDENRWNEQWVILDTRSDEEYFGTPASGDEAQEGGHIEGAYFLPYRDLLLNDQDHFFRPVDEMDQLFKKAGMDPEKQTVVYCGSGIRACAAYLAAKHLGYPVRLYDGSFEEWSELDLPLTGPVSQEAMNE
jgi:thiosulfate/3-mercaptopyruvate sulfurtransferase